jgi:putative MATE family efflux protein
MFVQSLYNVVDTFWIARLSALAVGGLTIVFPLQMIFVALGVGSGVGLNSHISRRFGAKDPESASHAASQVFFLAAVLGCAVILVARSLTGPVLSLFGATDVLRPIASMYLRLVCFGAPFLFFNMMANNLFRAQGDALKPMLVMLTGAVTNIILDPLLIFGIGPFPALGVEGAAIATTFSQMLGSVVCLFFLINRTSYTFTYESMYPDLAVLVKVYAVGAPAAVMQLMMSLVITVFNHVLGGFGNLAIAAFGLDFRIMSLFFMPMFGLSQGLMPIVGFNFGSERYDRLWEAVRTATLIAIGVGLLTVIAMQFLARPALTLISSDDALVDVATPALKLLILSVPLVSIQVMWLITYQALGRGTTALVLGAVRQIGLLIPLLLILPGMFGVKGVWMAMPIADLGGLLVMVYAIYALKREMGEWRDRMEPEDTSEDGLSDEPPEVLAPSEP